MRPFRRHDEPPTVEVRAVPEHGHPCVLDALLEPLCIIALELEGVVLGGKELLHSSFLFLLDDCKIIRAAGMLSAISSADGLIPCICAQVVKDTTQISVSSFRWTKKKKTTLCSTLTSDSNSRRRLCR